MGSLIEQIKNIKKLCSGGLKFQEASALASQISDTTQTAVALPAGKEDIYEGTFLPFLAFLEKAPHITQISLAPDKYIDFRMFFEGLKKTHVKSLHLNVPLDCASLFYEVLKEELPKNKQLKEIAWTERGDFGMSRFRDMPFKSSGLTSLIYHAPYLYNGDLKNMAENWPEQLDKLDFGGEKVYDSVKRTATEKQTINFINSLPTSLSELKLCSVKVTPAAAEALAEKIKQMPRLETLHLQSAGMNKQSIDTLAQALPFTCIKALKLDKKTTEQNISGLLSGLEKADTKVTDIGYDVSDLQLSDSFKNRLSSLDETRRQKDEKQFHPETADSLTAEDLKTSDCLFSAANKGQMADLYAALKKKKSALSVADYSRTDENGIRLIDSLSKNRQLAAVFSPSNWNNAKDMQTVFNMVPEKYKGQLDGKEGRPSFVMLKNKVMQDTIKAALVSQQRNK